MPKKPTSKITSFRLIPAQHYYQELLEAIRSSKKRIVITALTGVWDTTTASIFDALNEAQKRGIKVELLFDIYSILPLSTRPLTIGPVFWRRRRETLEAFSQLRKKGGQVDIVGTMGLNPFKKRFHAKIVIVDDRSYCFGGVNFYEFGFHSVDYMLENKNKKSANSLYTLVREFRNGAIHEDINQKLDGKSALLFDAGLPDKSIIYQTACNLAADAAQIWYVSQMPPSGKLARLINSTENSCYFNRTSQTSPPSNIAHMFDAKRYGTKNQYSREAYLHAKFILYELKNGDHALISGSHNFSWRGVAYGTQEIALYSSNDTLWQQLFEFLQQYIA